MNKILFCLLFVSFVAIANEAYKDGEKYGNANGPQLGDPNLVGQELLQHNKDFGALQSQNDTILAEKGANALNNSALGALLNDSNAKQINAREEHQIKPDNGLLKQSLAIEQDPFKQTGGKEMVQKSTVTKETKESCEEGVKFELDIVRQLVYTPPPRQTINTEITINYPEYVRNVGARNDEIGPLSVETTNYQVNIQRFRQYACPHFIPVDAVSGQRYTIDCNRIQNFSLVNVPTYNRTWITDRYGEHWNPVNLVRISYKHDTYQSEGVDRDSWTVLNPEQEELAEKHHCYETNRQCLETGNKHFDELVVTRPCWKEKVTYQCESEPLDGCRYLKEKNCTLNSSDCSQLIGSLCLKWKRNYTCLLKEELISPGIQSGDVFCLDGNCHTPNIEKNTDMNQAIANLALFSEMQKDMNHQDPPKVFKGECKDCNKHMLGFKNCCSSMKGWGTGISSCGEPERALAKQREQGLCHYVGTYCSDKVPATGICRIKKSTFCCFASKLARIFHEQGRGQIGMTWGSAENPDCRAFTVDELQRIDFSKIDLSEVFADLFKNISNKILKLIPRQMQDQMPTIQKNIDTVKQSNQKNWDNDNVQKTVF